MWVKSIGGVSMKYYRRKSFKWLVWSQVFSTLLNGGPYMVFGAILHRTAYAAMTNNLVLVDAFLALGSSILVNMLYLKFKEKVNEIAWVLLVLDIVLFFAMAYTPYFDIRDFMYISTVDGCFILGLYQQCNKHYFLQIIKRGKDRHTYDQLVCLSTDWMRLIGILVGFKCSGLEPQAMIRIIIWISLPGSIWSYYRYKTMEHWSKK
jgi:hypothetical protein